MEINSNYNSYANIASNNAVNQNTSKEVKEDGFSYSNTLQDNMDIFNSALKSSLEENDASASLITYLQEAFAQFARDISDAVLSDKPPQLELDLELGEMSLVAFIQKKLEELKEMSKDGVSIDEQKLLEELMSFFGDINPESLQIEPKGVNILA